MSLEEVVQTEGNSVVQAPEVTPAVQAPPSLTAVQSLEAGGVQVALPLTMVEQQLLELLFKHKGTIVSKAEIESVLYDQSHRLQPASNCIEVFVGRLRKKLSNREVIQTLRGRGYRLSMTSAELAEAACS